MKQLITLLVLVVGLAASGAAQQISFDIPGLKGKTTVSIQATSAQAMTSSGSPGRRGAPPSQYYLVTRSMDSHSQAIEDASNRGRAFRNVLMSTTLPDGTKQVRRLDQAMISDYSANYGSGSTETWRLVYSSSTIVN